LMVAMSAFPCVGLPCRVRPPVRVGSGTVVAVLPDGMAL
jgi:hypothetical protein